MEIRNTKEEEKVVIKDAGNPNDTIEFLQEISKEATKGIGFIPLVGAGFSAPSGVPIITEVHAYLNKCICLCLGLSQDGTRTKNLRWNPRTDQWPALIDRRQGVKPTRDWSDVVYRELHRTKARLSKTKDEDGVEELKEDCRLLSSALGAMQDWRTALYWIARIEIKRDRNSAKLSGASPSQQVIDACFRAVLKNKQPTLGHKMLGVLAPALRMDVVFTTNFDDLLEKGFEFARNPLAPVEIPLGGKLPNRSTVSDVRALLKLHGSRATLRANESLDESPTIEEKEQMLNYFLSPKGSSDFLAAPNPITHTNSQNDELEFESHLLVIGCGAKEKRVTDYVMFLCDKLRKRQTESDKEFRVFWVCYTQDDVTDVRKLFAKHQFGDRVTVIRHSHVGLLLLELYQFLRLELPPLGCIFPSISRTCQAPLLSGRVRGDAFVTKENGEFRKVVKDMVDRLTVKNQDEKGNYVLAKAKDELAMMSAGTEAFRAMELGRDKHCLWFDMNDISSADNLFEVLIESMNVKLGIEDWLPGAIRQVPPDHGMDPTNFYNETKESYRREIQRLVDATDRNWFLFLNAEEVPGANLTDPVGNGWIDQDRDSSSTSADKGLLSCRAGFSMVAELLLDCGVSVLLLLRENEKKDEQARLASLLALKPQSTAKKPLTFGPDSEEVFSVPITVADTEALIKNDPPLSPFLHALTLMQRPRLLATIWSNAVYQVEEKVLMGSKAQVPKEWVTDLEQKSLIRFKPGGFIWIHSICRHNLRKYFENDDKAARANSQIKQWLNSPSSRAQLHANLGAWYVHAIDATESPAAVGESAYHYCTAANEYVAALSDVPPGLPDGEDIKLQILSNAADCLHAAAAVLRSNSYLVQTNGYSRGSCRRLEEIGSSAKLYACPNAEPLLQAKCENYNLSVRGLWAACAEVMRAIAREVGEDFKAFERHRLIALLPMANSWKEAQEISLNTNLPDVGVRLAAWHEVREQTIGSAGSPNLTKIAEITLQIKAANNTKELVRFADWTRWQRWTLMLFISSRSYGSAQVLSQRLLGPASEQANIIADRNHSFRLTLKSQRQRLEVLRFIEQSVELHLLEFSVMQRGDAILGLNGRLTFERSLNEVDNLITRGLKLAEKIRHQDPSTDAHDISKANWCETRLLLHRSIIFSYLGADAMRVLSRAESKLRISDLRRHRSELAMIDLHRSESKTIAASKILSSQFSSILQDQAEAMSSVSWPDQTPQVIEKSKKDLMNRVTRASTDLDRAYALAHDSLRFLARAAPALKERRRNVWWTTWYFERRLRAISIVLQCTVTQTTSPIPFLGLEAAPYGTETECETLLNDCTRMVRVDAYRLASAIETYVSCLQMFHLRLLYGCVPKEPKAGVMSFDTTGYSQYEFRIRQMVERLCLAREELKNVVARRDAATGNNSEADDEVKKYVKKVGDQVDALMAKDFFEPYINKHGS